MKMKALKSFRHPNERRQVRIGDEFDVSDSTARELEILGHAVKVHAPAKMDDARKTKVEKPLENKAAETGPLASPGGETGAENAPSPSPAAPARRGRPSRQTRAGQE